MDSIQTENQQVSDEFDTEIKYAGRRYNAIERHLNALHDFVRQFSSETIREIKDLKAWKNSHVGQHNAEKGGKTIKEWKGNDQAWFSDSLSQQPVQSGAGSKQELHPET